VVVEERRDEGDEAVELGVMVGAVPEDRFGFVGREGAVSVPASRGDEVDLVVAVPVFEAVFALKCSWFEDLLFRNFRNLGMDSC
jgi:hypothetical protein